MTESALSIDDAVQSAFQQTVDDVASTVGITNFVASLHEHLNTYDIVVLAGPTPEVCVSKLFLFECALEKKRTKYRKVLADALQKSRKLERTLRHPVPIAQVIAWKEESRKWFKSNDRGKFIRAIPDSWFKVEIQHVVTVTEMVTGTSISETGDDIHRLTQHLKARLTNLVSGDDRILDLLDAARVKPEYQPNKISIKADDNTISATFGY